VFVRRRPTPAPPPNEAAKQLHEVRQSALDNDPQLTLTKLYNKRPTWLDNLHRDLDVAVCAAYGWEPDVNGRGQGQGTVTGNVNGTKLALGATTARGNG